MKAIARTEITFNFGVRQLGVLGFDFEVHR